MSSQQLVLKGNLARGRNGQQCGVVSNTFKLKLPDKEYYHYDREYRWAMARSTTSLMMHSRSLYGRVLVFLPFRSFSERDNHRYQEMGQEEAAGGRSDEEPLPDCCCD